MTVSTVAIEANGFTFRCRTAGDGGEPVILLHGFPETSHMWIPFMERLQGAGYQVLAPDQRGYSPGARPEGASEYQYEKLVADVMALADARGFGQFHLVGHDHGAGVGWTATDRHPDRIRSWTALSVPHVAAFGDAIRNDPDQRERSQYIGMFNREGVAETALGGNNMERLKAVWGSSPPEQAAEYAAVLGEDGALTAALNWYRGSLALEGDDATNAVGDISTPTLMIWGNKDNAIGRKSNEEAVKYMKDPYKFVELDAGHWLIQDEEERVSLEILEHLKANPVSI